MRYGRRLDRVIDPTLLVTADEMRLIEADTVRSGATWEGLMETAGQRVAEAILRRFGTTKERALILSGPGNNGGDGLVIARALAEHGWPVRCLTWHRHAEQDARLRDPLEQSGVYIAPLGPEEFHDTLDQELGWCTIVIDALLGTGLKRNIEGELAEIIATVAKSAKPVVSVDIATGIDSDTGEVRGTALKSSFTVAVGQYKFGHFLHPGKEYRREITLEDIGLDATKSKEIAKGTLLTEQLVRDILPARPDDSNKGTFGKAFVVAGSINYIGAAALATEGAMRSGAGLVTLGCPGDLLMILASKLTECTFLPLPSDLGAVAAHAAEKLLPELGGYKALLVGCGLGKDKDTVSFLHSLFEQQESAGHGAHSAQRPMGFAAHPTQEEAQKAENLSLPTLVLDGDALSILAEWDGWWSHVPSGGVLTPHPGEMARLVGSTVDEVQKDRVGIATSSAAKWKQVVVLKGAATVIAPPDGKIFVSPFSNPALATAGTGDVLSGTITGLIAQGLTPLNAACAGVYLHGMAGEMLREEYGVAGGLAGDLPLLIARAQQRIRDGGNAKGA